MRIRRFFKGFHKGQKGFTLVELLVVIAILGILAAIAIPNLVAFIGTGSSEAADTELRVVQTAVIGAMAANNVATVSGAPLTFSDTQDADVDGDTSGDVGAYIVNYGSGGVHGTYSIAADGTVTQTAYP